MVIFKDKRFITNSEHADDDFIGNADFVIPDGSELAQKILAFCPYFDFVFDEKGDIADVVEAERPPAPPDPPTNAELAAAIAELAEVICGG